uniref:Uncharacterized protein n=1 Tax=Solanum tuberosum TaxID=4113 RepID=M1DAF6_SOLTU
MVRPYVAATNQLPRKRARGIVINEEAAASRAPATKLPPKRGKDKVQDPPPRSLNRLKFEGLRTILEDKRFSIDSVVDRYLEVWNTMKFHRFEIFTEPRTPYIPTWVRKFYSPFGEPVLKGKKKPNAFKQVDFGVVQEKKVKYSSTEINEVVGCS